MGKPRIIIADADESYIAPLQSKFIETFFDKIDLEIITDPLYFQRLFASPQKMDILIVSEAFYSPELQRHNIGNFFLMCEQPSAASVEGSGVVEIFKYTNVKEIFNEIIGSSAETLQIKTEMKKQTQTILVYSAGGGDGKTTIALGISSCLAMAHKKVLYIDAEFVQNFQFFLQNKTPISGEILSKFQLGNEHIFSDVQPFIRQELFSYLPPFHAAISAYNIDFSVFSYLIAQIKKENVYDFIIIDTDSAFSDDKGDQIDQADKILIVTKQDFYSVYKTNCMLKNINYSDTEKFVFLCNAFQSEYDNALLDSKSHATFMVNQYIHWIPECEKMRLEELAKIDGLQKIAYALL